MLTAAISTTNSDAAPEHLQRRAHVADEVVGERLNAGPCSRLRRMVSLSGPALLGHGGVVCVDPGLGPFERDSRREPRQQLVVLAPAAVLARTPRA